MLIRTERLDREFPDLEAAILAFWPASALYRPVWQSLSWNRMLQSAGQAESGWFAGVFEGAELLAYAVLERRNVGFGKFGLFAIGGPNAKDVSAMDSLAQALVRLGRDTASVFVQAEPVSLTGLPGFREGEWRHFLEPCTLTIDLALSEEEILAQMKQKGRYNVRLAEKHAVAVERSSGTAADLAAFMRLLEETLERDGFSGNPRKYYEALLASRVRPEEGLYLAKKDGEVLAAAVLVTEGTTAVYYYGASTSDNEKRKFMPAYLLQWAMMRAAKEAGCLRYDFLGVAPEDAGADHRLAGVSDFKRKFGGETLGFPAPSIVVVRPWAYRMLAFGRRARGMFR